MKFDNFSFNKQIRASIDAFGYQTPTPIQTRAIPAVLAGRDVMGLAETGTGKTAAFALPISQNLLKSGSIRRGRVRVLVLAPTRELALQIHETFEAIGRKTGIFSAAVFGGVSIGSQIKALRQATVVVACPGRLLDLLNRGAINLGSVDTLVVDEADRMFDMGFIPDLRKIMARLPIERQNLMFSATMPSEVKRLCDGVLRDPEVVQVANMAPPAAIHHSVYPVAKHLKTSFLESLLKQTEHDCVLVFTRTKHLSKSLAGKLERKGWPVTSLQGNLSQNRRQEALDGFRRGRYRIMIATDIAARGIDCPRISHVINYDLPDTPESYTHRIGRTGRAERSGEAMTLLADEDRRQMQMIERALDCSIERCRLDGFDYGAPGKPSTGRNSAPARHTSGRKGSVSAKNGNQNANRNRKSGGNPKSIRDGFTVEHRTSRENGSSNGDKAQRGRKTSGKDSVFPRLNRRDQGQRHSKKRASGSRSGTTS